MPARTHPWMSRADRMAERHAQTFTTEQIPYCPVVHRLRDEGFNAHQIAMQTRRPMIDVRLILAAIEAGRVPAQGSQTEVTTRVSAPISARRRA